MIIFLLPPSEGKTAGGELTTEKTRFTFDKPLDIAVNATPKDLKCQGARYEEGISLNKSVLDGPFMPAIERYSGVMFKAVEYAGMTEAGRMFFNEHFMIVSGLYGLTTPCDAVANYKLPISTKGLTQRWGAKLTDALNDLNPDIVVDLLPGSYKKVINFSKLNAKVIQIDFYQIENNEKKKLTHGVKKVKGQWVKEICETQETLVFGVAEGKIEIIR